MSSNLYELLVWLGRQYNRVKIIIQNDPELASIVCKVLDEYPLLIVEQAFKYAHRVAMQLYIREADMPCPYPEFMVRILKSQCERLMTVYKKKHYSIIIDGYDHAEPHDVESSMDVLNGIDGILPHPLLQN